MSERDRLIICLIALAASIVLWIKKRSPKAHALAMFVAIASLLGGAIGGWLPWLVLQVAHWTRVGEDKLIALAFGGGSDPGIAATVLALTVAWFVVDDLRPKHAANRLTVILAAVLPVLFVVAGGQLASIGQANVGGPATAGPTVVVQVHAAAPASDGAVTSWNR